MNGWRSAARFACLLVLCAVAPVAGQRLPEKPIVLADGLVTLGGDVVATTGSSDPGFFNYTDYEDSTLRMLRLDVAAALRFSRRVSLLGEVRSQNGDAPEAYALYVRVRPWVGRRVDIQVGRIPPVFGAFGRHRYETDNPLIGYPLAYQYLTSLRADAVPASADELIQMRGRGWLASYTLGNTAPAPGVPLVSALRWDTGVQGSIATDRVEVAAAVTLGTLSRPLFQDDNDGRQLSGRVTVRPVTSLVVGTSVARGPFVSSGAARAATGSGAPRGDFLQTAWGTDLEYSRGYVVLRAETVLSRWTLPVAPRTGVPAIDGPLRALASAVEGRYKIGPGLYVAARAEHLGFSDVTGSRQTTTWDAPVTRLEVGGGYSLQRNLLLKLSLQFNTRQGGRTRSARPLAGQLVYWF